MKRYVPVQKRTIRSVGTPNTRFGFEWFPTRQSGVPFLNYRSYVFRMNRFGPAPPTNLFEGLTKKIQPSPIKVIQVTIRPRGMDKCRGRINGAPKCIFGGSRLLVSRSSNRLH